ncbi:MAG TPA: hypothetical protein VME45_14900 [Stellaceae bacterium]|nr:hypothetical protein [Stellaceae bacterium]
MDFDLPDITQGFREWFECVIRPVATTRRLTRAVSTGHSIKPIIEIWLAAAVIGFILLLPLTRILGIRDVGISFYIPLALLQIFLYLAGALSVHITLLLRGILSSIPKTLALYTINVVYFPICNLILLRASYETFYCIQKVIIDKNDVDVKTFSIELYKNIRTFSSSFPYYVDQLLQYGAGAVGILMLSAFAELLIQHYGISRREIAYSSVAFALTGSVAAALLVIFPLQFFFIYCALK